MSRPVTARQIVARLEENNLFYGQLALQNEISLLVTERGGRILGPFLAETGESIFWANGVFGQADSFRRFLQEGEWNLGGERVWIAPEIQYAIRNRHDFWGSYHLPEQMDPGRFTLDQPRPGQWRLRQEMSLTAYNLASGQKELRLERLIHRVKDPLRCVSGYNELLDGVIFAGYEQVVSLAETRHDAIMSAAWNVIQLNPGGTLLLPTSPAVEVTNYMEPVDAEHQTFSTGLVRLKLSGSRRYKVGYKAAHVFGRLAYLNHLADGRAYLLVRNFFNNPSAPYLEEPPDQPGRRGDSVYVYNDNGAFGGYGELECHGQAIGGESGRSAGTDQQVLWLYIGPLLKLRAIIPHLLGIDFN